MIGIINYGAGNLRSVEKAFDYLHYQSRILDAPPKSNTEFDCLVLPGVGAFGAAIEKLKLSGFYGYLQEYIKNQGKLLGICLGMQMLVEQSEESPNALGLGAFLGDCRRFSQGKVPQIGWNQLDIKRDIPLFDKIPDHSFFYFIHGYYVKPRTDSIIAATAEYHLEYAAVTAVGNCYGVQFHPEKSGDVGLQLLRNWVEKC
jgi:glutamine amidotransferase